MLGQIAMSVSAAQSASLAPATYAIQVTVAPVGTSLNIIVFEGSLKILASPGTAVLPPTYCTVDDMKIYAPWIEDLQDLKTDVAGFLSQRGRARTWFEDLIHRHYRYGGGISRQQNLLIGGMGKTGYRTGMRNPFVVAALANNSLIVTDQIKEANARYAIALVCDGQVGLDNPYRQKAEDYFYAASNIAQQTTCELDTNNDGFTDMVVDLGICDVLAS